MEGSNIQTSTNRRTSERLDREIKDEI